MGLLYGLTSTNTYYFKNKTTVNQSSTFTATNSNVKRIFFSDGGYNETTSNLLSLSTTSNLMKGLMEHLKLILILKEWNQLWYIPKMV
jgi:hypothetical protein